MKRSTPDIDDQEIYISVRNRLNELFSKGKWDFDIDYLLEGDVKIFLNVTFEKDNTDNFYNYFGYRDNRISGTCLTASLFFKQRCLYITFSTPDLDFNDNYYSYQIMESDTPIAKEILYILKEYGNALIRYFNENRRKL